MPNCQRKSIVYIIFIALSAFRGLRSEKPVIIQRPISQNVHLNQSATFICRAQSTLQFTIDWMKDVGHNGQLLHSYLGSLLVVDGNLTFLHAKHSDEGTYKCIAKNIAGTSTAQATLRVLDLPVAPIITEISPNQTIVEGKRVTFTCKASGNPLPRITWKVSLESGFDNTDHIERPSPQSIRISSVSPRDSGKYVCIAENDSGNDTDAVYLNVLGYPVFIVSPPSSLIVDEGTSVSLNCKVIGSPKAAVNWYYGKVHANQISNIIVLGNNTLHIHDVKFGDSGRYACVANNSAGLQRSKSTLLKISRAPKLDCCPNSDRVWQNQTAIAGEPVSLYCLAAGYPEPEYAWMFENNTISSFSVFTINNVSTRNEGVYSCKANNSLGEVSLLIYLNVVVPPEVSVQPPEAIAVKGERVEFTCTATGLPLPIISWYSTKKFILRNNTLAIVNVSKNDQGEYFCEAKNDAGQKRVRARLVVAVRPTFLILPRNISVNESSSVNIQCLARGPDEPIINWYRLTIDNQKINLNLSGNVLTITKVDRNVTGFYVCEAKNYAGYINATFFINVQYRPYALISQQKVSIVTGKRAILFCPIKANPVAEIQWKNPILYEGPRLTIPKVDTSHRGQYSCRGKNILGAIEVTLQVQILTAPRIVDLKMVELLNNFVTLSCVTMEAESVVHWIDLTSLPFGSFIVDRGSLQIEKRYINAMNFICNASNVHGWMIKYVRVPRPPHNFNVTKISSNGVTFLWSYDNTEIISNFIVERRSTSDLKWVAISSSVASPSYEDRDLSPFTTFMYRISAENALGTSKPSGIFNASTQEGVPSSPSKLEAKSFSLTSITVYWEPPYEPRGQLTNIMYELCYKESTALPQCEVEITVNTTVQYKIQRLKSNTLYIVKIRAGRQAEGSVRWSEYKLTRTKTLQKAPRGTPKEIKAVSNGPRKIHVTWKIPLSYVGGYKLQHKEYESTNITKVVIRSWNSSSFMITGLAAGRYYEIQMNMFTTGGDGPWSDPIVVHTDQDRLSLPGPIASSSDSLPWKIAVGGSVMAIILLLLLLVYIYLVRKSKHTESSESKKTKKSRNQGGYDFTDNASRVSNESEGSIEGVYNVNIENDIDLSMFDNSHHSEVEPQKSYLYIENPILPAPQEDSDDSCEAVRLATFIARPSPQPTPYLTARRQLSENHVNPAYHSDTDDDIPMYAVNVDHAANLSTESDDKDIPVYAQVDFAAKERDRQAQENNTQQQFSDDILI